MSLHSGDRCRNDAVEGQPDNPVLADPNAGRHLGVAIVGRTRR
jgi:hypothetical protein